LPNQVTRKRLLDAAYRILAEESLSQLSIEHVSEVAGLSRRTFFLHFSSKDQLFAEVLTYLRPAFAEAYRQCTQDLPSGLSVEDRITALFRKLAAKMSGPGWRGGVFIRLSAEFTDVRGHPVHAVVAEAQRDLESWLEEELRDGGHGNPALVARQLALLVNGMLMTQLIHRNPSYTEAALAMLPPILSAAPSFTAAG
jgi:AcrR family transcriptional regulator